MMINVYSFSSCCYLHDTCFVIRHWPAGPEPSTISTCIMFLKNCYFLSLLFGSFDSKKGWMQNSDGFLKSSDRDHKISLTAHFSVKYPIFPSNSEIWARRRRQFMDSHVTFTCAPLGPDMLPSHALL